MVKINEYQAGVFYTVRCPLDAGRYENMETALQNDVFVTKNKQVIKISDVQYLSAISTKQSQKKKTAPKTDFW